jgi:NarL family two-component system response regulator LiaR
MSERIRVMVVDDHLMVREGLATLLETFPDLHLVGEASGGAEAAQICSEVEPDVVLMDLVMPDLDGIEATKAILAQNPGTRVLALTSFKEDELVKGALEAGAVGYLLKNITADELANGIRAAARGELVIAPEASRVLIETMRAPAPPGRDLTEREQEVLQLLVEGLSNSDIGDRLEISPHTVKNHLRSIYTKLGVSTRTAASSLAIKHGLVDLD